MRGRSEARKAGRWRCRGGEEWQQRLRKWECKGADCPADWSWLLLWSQSPFEVPRMTTLSGAGCSPGGARTRHPLNLSCGPAPRRLPSSRLFLATCFPTRSAHPHLHCQPQTMSITRTLSFRALSGSTRALAARPIAPASAPASTASCLASTSKLASLAASRPRYLSRSSRCAAAVSSGETSHIIDSTRQTNSPDGRTPLQVRRDQNASPQDRKSALDEAKERKFRQYEKLLKAKAAE